MSHIVLTDDQLRTMGRESPVEVRDSRGTVVGFIEPLGFSEADLSAARQRALTPGPWYTSDQIRQHLKGLAEADERGELRDKTQLREVLQRLRAQDGR